jgi:rod shape-determining protein MreC
MPYPFQILAVTVGRPIFIVRDFIEKTVFDKLSLIRSKSSLIDENRDLKLSVVALESRLADRDLLAKENISLKELLGRPERKVKTILARVLSTPRSAAYDVLIIDVGREDGLEVGQEAIVGAFAAGRISQVYPRTAKVLLFSSPGEKTDVVIADQNAIVTALGKGGGNFEATFPKEVEVSSGDTVSFPHIQPRVFGVVEDVVVHPTDSFQTVLFKNPFNANELAWVEVVIDSKKP